ncbi:pilus assembly protein CpaB [Rhodococcus sp. 14C212]|uniref:acyl-CoA dehydrogenase family protein n=1 Tax=Rhodococcus sp. 14C212 TaxID=2711209 RepID=UPI0013EB7C1D|nr:acyl-CoA dehydrogenase [Rhodococcus sp. 14C212]NGP05122.1 pilus assembly protein CpaB [Rhodococcus sp. 14C212]
MDFSFTEEQALLRDSVSQYLQRHYTFEDRQTVVRSKVGWSREVWQGLGRLGLYALPFPEETGGLGGSIVDVVATAELLGAHMLVEPYVASIVLAGAALAAVPEHADAAHRLRRIVAGEAIGAFAHEEGSGMPDPALVATRAKRTANGYVLAGEKKVVLHGADADILVLSARLHGQRGDPDGLALFVVDPPAAGIAATPFVTVDGRRAAHLRFDDAELGPDALLAADAHDVILKVLDRAIVALAAEAVGAMGELLHRTAEYAATREQFGVPIGTFQAVAHRLADMKIAYVKARSTLLYTTALAEAGQAEPHDLAVLKAQVGRLGRMIGESAIQTHGGVGMTDELPIGHLHKRILVIDAMFGTTDHHLRTVGGGRPEPRPAIPVG